MGHGRGVEKRIKFINLQYPIPNYSLPKTISPEANMAPSTLYVNPATGKDSGAGTQSAPLKTIARALQLITSGNRIQLAAGTYSTASGEVFPLVIPAGVVVVGNESTKGKGIAIAGGGAYTSPTLGNQNIALRLDANSQLRGVTVTNSAPQGTGVWIEAGNPTLANNTFTGCGIGGVFATGTAKPIILDNLFVQNATRGLSLGRNAKGEVRRNVVERSGNGMAISDRSAPLIADNKIFANTVGIVLSNDARPVLRRNLIEKNSQAGLIVKDNARPALGSNQDPAGNILRDNGSVDLQNATNFKLVSSGNQLNPARVQGQMEFVAAIVPQRPLGPAQFSDVAGYWAEVFIQGLVTRGLISGFPDGSFKPEASITRAEYAAIIAKTFNLPAQAGRTGVFKDVPNNFWAAPAIRKAAQMGFISGFPDGTFRPRQNLTRIQAIVSLVSGLGWSGGNTNLVSIYRDRAQIPSYATNAAATATQKRLIVNYPQVDQLEPMRDITRASVAALIYQALVATGQASAISSPYIVNPDPSAPSFTDIQQHWSEPFVRGLATQDLIGGFANGSFKPDEQLNRAAYAALLVKAFNPPPKRPAVEFSDVPPDFWAYKAIQQATMGGFMSGYPDGKFRPTQNLLRLQLIVSLANGLGLPAGDEKILTRYDDIEAVPASVRSSVASATQRGININYSGMEQINPTREVTRGEAAAMVYQALVTAGRLPAIKSPYVVIERSVANARSH